MVTSVNTERVKFLNHKTSIVLWKLTEGKFVDSLKYAYDIVMYNLTT